MSNALFWLYCMVPLLAVGNPVWAQAQAKVVPSEAKQSLVQVRAYKNNELLDEASGFVINRAGNVLTSAHVLRGADRITVFSLKQTAEISAKRTHEDYQQNLALLYVQGLGLPPLSFSQNGDDTEGKVQVPQFTSETSVEILKGEITRHGVLDDGQVQLLQHNAIITAKEFGMPVFNACGQVIAINQPLPTNGRWPAYDAKVSSATVYALRSVNIKPVLEKGRAPFTLIDKPCLSEEQDVVAREINTEVNKLKGILAITKKTLENKEDEIRKIEEGQTEQKKILDEEIKAFEAMTNKMKGNIDSLEKKLEENEKETEDVESRSESRWLWTVFGGGGVVLLALIGWLVVSSKQKAQAESSAAAPEPQDAQDAPPTAPTTLPPPGPRAAPLPPAPAAPAAPSHQSAPFSCLLEGQDSANRSHSVNIPANRLGDPAGVALGRSQRNADFVIDNESVSRAHIRLTYVGGQLYVEDLNTTNGTKVNGNPLSPRNRAPLRDNDRLQVGPIAFTVRLV